MACGFSTHEAAKILSLSVGRLKYWRKISFIAPTSRVGRRWRYSFADLIALRTAKMLLDAGVPLSQVRSSLFALKNKLPNAIDPLKNLRISASPSTDGAKVLVESARGTFEAKTGQVLLNFETETLGRTAVMTLKARVDTAVDKEARKAAFDKYLEGCRYDEDPDAYAQAEAAYHEALRLDPTLAHAHTNLGNLKYRQGDLTLCRAYYQSALRLDPCQPEALFNLGFLATVSEDDSQARNFFLAALKEDPAFADAHYNLAEVFWRLAEPAQARKHWRAFIELEPKGPLADHVRLRLAETEANYPQ